MTPNRTDKPPDLPQKGAKTPPKGAEHCNLRGIWLVEAVLYRNLQGFVVLAGPKKHPVATVGFGGSRRAKKHPSLAATIPPHVCSANRKT